MSNLTQLVTFAQELERRDFAKHEILDRFAVHIETIRKKFCLACPFCKVKLEALRIFVHEIQTAGTVPQCPACYRVFHFHLSEDEVYQIQDDGTFYVVSL